MGQRCLPKGVQLPSFPRSQSTLSKLGFICGWLLFFTAFLAAAFESVIGQGFITPAEDLLRALSPAKWIIFKSQFSSPLFEMVVMSLLQLPGWFLAGLPAFVLIWRCRPHRERVDPELYESLTTYDRLADLAKEEGALDDDPTFTDFKPEDYEEDDLDRPQTAKAYMKGWRDFDDIINDIRNESQDVELTPEEKMEKARERLPIPFDKLS